MKFFALGLILLMCWSHAEFVHWESIHIDINVEEDGQVTVREDLTYVFSGPTTSNRHRSIATKKIDAVENVYVFLRKGTRSSAAQDISFTTEYIDNHFHIRWSHPVKKAETQIFTLQYNLVGAIHTSKKNSYLDVVVIPFQHKKAILQANITLHMPCKIEQLNKLLIYGQYLRKSVNPYAVRFSSSKPLYKGEGARIRCVFANDIIVVRQPEWFIEKQKKIQQKKAENSALSWREYTFALLFIIIMFMALRHDRRNPSKGGYGYIDLGFSDGGGDGGGGD